MHKSTGVEVAFKRRTSWAADAIARMGREIEFGKRFSTYDHIMPILDYCLMEEWFVMPLAQVNAEQARSSLSGEAELLDLVLTTCSALEVAHGAGWLHRDLKPANLLLVNGSWTVADWGLGKRPRGETTHVGRTTVGEFYGTYGFAAPEQAVDAHAATASADFYSLGQIIGWARTGGTPKHGVPLVPGDEPWRSIVTAATQADPAARPQNAREFKELISAEGINR